MRLPVSEAGPRGEEDPPFQATKRQGDAGMHRILLNRYPMLNLVYPGFCLHIFHFILALKLTLFFDVFPAPFFRVSLSETKQGFGDVSQCVHLTTDNFQVCDRVLFNDIGRSGACSTEHLFVNKPGAFED